MKFEESRHQFLDMIQNTLHIRKSKSINGWDVGSGPPASYQPVHNRLIRLSQRRERNRMATTR